MSITAKALIDAKYANGVASNLEYLVPAATRTIIDKFTATNTDGSSQTIDVHLVPFGGTSASSNLVISALSIAAGATTDITALQNHILSTGDAIYALASVASKVVIRASGREVV